MADEAVDGTQDGPFVDQATSRGGLIYHILGGTVAAIA